VAVVDAGLTGIVSMSSYTNLAERCYLRGENREMNCIGLEFPENQWNIQKSLDTPAENDEKR
jgi:hypothetical protein